MRYRFSSPWLRLLALVLAAACLAGVFFYGINAIICLNRGMFEDDPVFQTTWQCADLVRSQGMEVIEQFRRNPDFQYWDRMLKDTNLRFIILDERTGDVKASYLEGLSLEEPANLADNIFLHQYDGAMSRGEYGTPLEKFYICDYYFGVDWSSESSYLQLDQEQQWVEDTGRNPMTEQQEDGVSHQILYLMDEYLDAYCGDSIGNGYRLFRYFRGQAEQVLPKLLLCAVGLLILMVYLVVTAGRRPGKDELKQIWFDRIPTDVLLAAAAAACLGFVGLMVVQWDAAGYNWHITLRELAMIQTVTTVGAVVCGIVLLLILCSFSVRVKAGRFWQSALLFRGLIWCWKLICRTFGRVGSAIVMGFRSIGMIPRTVLAFLLVMFVECCLLVWLVNDYNPALPIMALIVFNFGLLGVLFWAVAQMKILQNAAKHLAEGNLEERLELGKMYWDFRKHGEYLSAIAGGMNKAVEQRIKSERLKTELITNVSHDIKTPLTSIVNYVDLLQKPHTEAEGIQYLEVLDRQAKRLKKLTENLVEASKASTGNLPVFLQPTSVLELVNQSVEEYRERLEAGRLEIITDLRGDLSVLADGKLLWRVMDNLLNNVVKYALAGTRVYVMAHKQDERVILAVKNISRDPLNIDAEELMERFVRGDSSRHTEGSGLGLNIARSLTQIQNGIFDLTVDGDLFKASISLPAVV